ncbi:GDP-L-fucose synthase family protein [Microbacterium trichothecenolyticum]|uniref:GDP-L-fucose synthase n=1 Tax=Microbacterium trichothecenolyticum TaxID=69370 RepID=A0A0M2H9D5_MICTR|nr:GDP-L-fucose synthase [Microbacterium trichothecenolyticum]KJL41236.1 GDP-L-fucose synthase [Microbacterium trichothecenolyticum]
MRVLLTGGNGMLARAIGQAWEASGRNDELVPVTRADADLRDQTAVRELIADRQPDLVIHAAAKVGGIAANVADPAGFLMDNLRIDTNLLSASLDAGVTRFLYFGSSCMYPKDYRQPLVETDVLAAPLEPTNEGYALSKIASARFCEYVAQQFGHDYRVIIPSNLYGPNDDFSLDRGHLVAATIAKAHRAKEERAAAIDVWGDGTARREFTYVGDLADWIVGHLDSMHEWPTLMNVGQGDDHSVLDYYEAALAVVGYECDLVTDPTKPAGMRQKLMDSSLAADFGWAASTTLREGMRRSYEAYLRTLETAKEGSLT